MKSVKIILHIKRILYLLTVELPKFITLHKNKTLSPTLAVISAGVDVIFSETANIPVNKNQH